MCYASVGSVCRQRDYTTRLCPVQVPLLQLTDPSLKKEDEGKRTISKLAAETRFNYFIYLKHTPGERAQSYRFVRQ